MITLITGGQRSGKSLYAEQMALEAYPAPYYLATAGVEDDEMAERVRLHRARRGPQWHNVDAPLHPEEAAIEPGATVLLDCITMLATNRFFEAGEDKDKALEGVIASLDSLFSREADFIIVTGEIGLGGISANPLQRQFTDLLGAINQWIAARADSVVMMVSGIPLKLK